MDTPAVRDGALLLFRAILGVVFCAHGFEKLFIVGPAATTQYFQGLGIPQPGLIAWCTGAVELLGGALLVIGLLSTVVAGLLCVIVLGALWFQHAEHGFFIASGGFEYVLVLAAGLIMIVVFGPGRVSVDGLVYSRDRL
ncbi:DoxX family protein [Corynebacterium choanae]|uniref:Oxidoreductase MhqP n=1 Tax=Corynebacterium choanae TaxID=1862358 RepID=A0A3G6J4U7_9CORY|nr:DoxX family protein [Corynebacterium choanae]AZA13115.1 Putative oxidoreductase MhqP [Corynebacterium choanae]